MMTRITTYPPIFIAGCVRSGTSLLAQILMAHGVFIGEAKSTRYPGTNTPIGTERTAFKPIIKELMAANGYAGRRSVPIPSNSMTIRDLRRWICNLYPSDKPWLIKASGLLWFADVFDRTFPEAIWLLPWRPVDDTVDSILRHPGMSRTTPDREKLRLYVVEMHNRQMNLACQPGASKYAINMDNVVMRGLTSHIGTTLAAVGLKLDVRIINEIVDHTKWHASTAKKETSHDGA